ncbi:MAG: hypothetical protein NDI69_08860 [Bacteriovoracaceae bacterium]|nr:hypothetical protein [Bacteriovoracaceae bacterium]
MKYFMEKPVLAIGLLMFGLFIYQVASDQKWGIFHNDKLISTSCKAVLVRLEKKIPDNWKVFCEGNNLAVEINEVVVPADATNLKALMYRQLANHMSFVARSSYSDILEKVFFVRFKLTHPKMVINAVTEGKFIVKLSTLETPEHVMTHLQSTVQVKEDIK